MPESRIGPTAAILGINTNTALGRIDVAGSTGDTIPTVRVRGVNQTAPVVDIDSTGFPAATTFFSVSCNGTRVIRANSNTTVEFGAITSNGNFETTSSPGLYTFIRYQNDNADSCIRIGLLATNSTGSCFTIATGTDSGGNGGTTRMTINARSAGVSRRAATATLTAGVAAFGTVALTAGTATVSSDYVAATDIIRVNMLTPGGTSLSVSYGPGTITPGTPGTFVVRGLTAAGAVNTLDTSTVTWEIIRPLTNA
jgi:hypothetical protein